MIITKAVNDLMESLRRLPGVGEKTAQRFVFHLLARDRVAAQQIVDSLHNAIESVTHCKICNNFSESEICKICASSRDHSQLCVVETPADLTAFEESGTYNGLYFVLMGRISPLDGIGPDDLGIHNLLTTLRDNAVEEVILATNITIEGDATASYLSELLIRQGYMITRIARGLPLGGEIEYMDKGTLIEAFQRRTPL